MFNSKDDKQYRATSTPAPTPSFSSEMNVIGSSMQVDGEIETDSDIRIDGKVKGTIHSKSKIIIGPTGVVDGDIVGETAEIGGKIFGKVEISDMLFLKSSGYLEGDITTGKLVVEAGARFTGSCRMGVKEIKPNEKPSANPLQKKEAI